MSRYVRANISVICHHQCPVRFKWKDIWREVAILVDFWREVGAWWDGELEKDVYLLLDINGGYYEVFHERESDRWFLNRVMD